MTAAVPMNDEHLSGVLLLLTFNKVRAFGRIDLLTIYKILEHCNFWLILQIKSSIISKENFW